jgi:hypothetical protein
MKIEELYVLGVYKMLYIENYLLKICDTHVNVHTPEYEYKRME